MLTVIARGTRMAILMSIPLLVITACGGDSDPDPSGIDSDAATPAVSPTPPRTTASPVPLPDPVRAAIRQAAEDAGVAIADVELRQYERQEWPSSALGCPEQGKMYAQVITSGYIVHIRVNGDIVRYHTDAESIAIRCDNPPPSGN